MGAKKTVNIEVEGASITILNQGEQDYLALTDMLKAKEGDFIISDWLRNRNTNEFIGIFGKGFDISNLRNMRRFYQAFPIQDAVRLELSWTHYRALLRTDNLNARDWYTQETIEQNSSARALERQISVLY